MRLPDGHLQVAAGQQKLQRVQSRHPMGVAEMMLGTMAAEHDQKVKPRSDNAKDVSNV